MVRYPNNSPTVISIPGGSSRSAPSLTMRVATASPRAGVVDDDALVGIDDQVMRDRRDAEIAPQLVAQIGHRIARRQHLEHDDRIRNLQRVTGTGSPQ